MEPWVQLLGYLARPIMILVILLLARHEMRRALKSLEERIRDPRSKFTAAVHEG